MKKLQKILIQIVIATPILALASVWYQCTTFDTIERFDVIKKVSPDRRLVGIVTEIIDVGSGDSMYEVKIKENKSWFSNATVVALFKNAFRNDCASGVDIEWRRTGSLLMTYFSAEEVGSPSLEASLGRRQIVIERRSRTLNESARCGYMSAPDDDMEEPLETPIGSN